MDGTFPINSHLPAERELAELLGVTRPTLREALQRLERDGFVEIQHGKPTRVRDFWIEGNLGVTIALAQYQDPLPEDLSLIFFLSAFYSRQLIPAAADNPPANRRIAFHSGAKPCRSQRIHFALFDWELHWQLTIHAGNAFFTHFMNSVKRLYTKSSVFHISATSKPATIPEISTSELLALAMRKTAKMQEIWLSV